MLVLSLAILCLGLAVPAVAILVTSFAKVFRAYLATDDTHLLAVGTALLLMALSIAMVAPAAADVISITGLGRWRGHGWHGEWHGGYCWWWRFIESGAAPPLFSITVTLHYLFLTASYVTLLATYITERRGGGRYGLVALFTTAEVGLAAMASVLTILSLTSRARRYCVASYATLALSHVIAASSMLIPTYPLFWVGMAFRIVGVATLSFVLR